MSDNNITIECPECKAKNNILCWQNINSVTTPSAKEQLLSGELFSVKCSNCGKTINFNYPMLYHDPIHRCIVDYTSPLGNTGDNPEGNSGDKSGGKSVGKPGDKSEDNLEDNTGNRMQQIRYLQAMSDTYKDQLDSYKIRLVSNQNELREKAIIFENNLDDRVIEIIKLIYLLQLSKDKPDIKIKATYYLRGEKGNHALQFLSEDGRTFSAEIDNGLYDDINNDYGSEFDGFPGNQFVIDAQWATRFLHEQHQSDAHTN